MEVHSSPTRRCHRHGGHLLGTGTAGLGLGRWFEARIAHRRGCRGQLDLAELKVPANGLDGESNPTASSMILAGRTLVSGPSRTAGERHQPVTCSHWRLGAGKAGGAEARYLTVIEGIKDVLLTCSDSAASTTCAQWRRVSHHCQTLKVWRPRRYHKVDARRDGHNGQRH